MAKQKTVYQCRSCNWRTNSWLSKCGNCQSYNAMQEVAARNPVGVKTSGAATPEQAAVPISQVNAAAAVYLPTGSTEFDRVLGGGCVPGAAILFSGEPGIGKSTLLLQIAAMIASQGARVLYVSGEESAGQIKLRAERIRALHDSLFLASETSLNVILGHIKQVRPDFMILDSVQTVASSDIEGIAGAPAQVREVATVLVRVAKNYNMPLMLVGHVTKDGNVAGPRTLEHLVDVVCQFEGDRQTPLRFLRTLKNRFGPTDEVGCFTMAADGIQEVADPSELFVSSSATPVSGTCVALTLEGRRVLPIEVQALVVPTTSPNPRRVTNGVEQSRTTMILAVLERCLQVKLHDKDVYVATVGGVKISEPGLDLAIALAVLSAAFDKPLPSKLAAAAEISLVGKLRGVVSVEQRQKEAQRLGYTNFATGNGEDLVQLWRSLR